MCEGALGNPSTVINSFHPVVQQAMNVIEHHFQKSEPLLHSLSLSQSAVQRAAYDLIMMFSIRLFSLEMVWNLSIFDFLAPIIHFLFGKGHHKVMTCPCSCDTCCPPGGPPGYLAVIIILPGACSASTGPLLHRGWPCCTSPINLLTCVFVGCYP